MTKLLSWKRSADTRFSTPNKPAEYLSTDGRFSILPELGGSGWELGEFSDGEKWYVDTFSTVADAKDAAERAARKYARAS